MTMPPTPTDPTLPAAAAGEPPPSPPPARRRTSRRQRVAAVLVALLALIGLACWLFQWNWLRPMIERRVSDASGRSFEMRGDLDVKLGLKPRITARELVLGNTPGGSAPEMARVGRLELVVDLPRLFSHRLVLPEVTLENADVLLEKRADGSNNWLFERGEAGGWPLVIGQMAVRQGRLRFLDPQAGTALQADLSLTPGQGGKLPLAATLAGRYRKLDAGVSLRGGPLLSLRDPGRPYPLAGGGKIGKTRFEASGTVTDPLRLAGLSVDFSLAGASMDELYRILGLPLPPTRPYQLRGHLQHSAAVWSLRRFSGRVGASDLGGDFSVDRGKKPQFIEADLRSQRLDLADLAGFIGGRKADGDKTPQPSGKVLPHAEFRLDKLNAANVEARLRGQHITTADWLFEDLDAFMAIRDGQLRLEPLKFGMAGGQLSANIAMDARSTPIATQARIEVQRLQLQRLFPQLQLRKASSGLIGGRVKLAARGNSVAAMLGSASGDAALAMKGGEISKLLLRLANLDVTNTLVVLLTGDKPVPIRCAVADLAADDGRMKVRTLLIDTEKQVITGEGGVDLRNEALDLKLVADPKDVSLVALRGPILIKGTLADPDVRPSLGQAAGRTGLAALLGSVAGPLAILPLVELGGAEDSNCAALLQRSAERGAKAPAKGKGTGKGK
ncbi:AsmA family protein [Chitinimonas koreensis]|uniref:AsmA family protein n=1 Tax=Chitinimonas koreensis TaxID=356302 RepID=UPI000490914D|nr:AsmA family protein [Chitinimonas koreensis]QNM98815.1 AsmA family protein [Chitinimonas koreensis]